VLWDHFEPWFEVQFEECFKGPFKVRRFRVCII